MSMSRIGKKAIKIPDAVKVSVVEGWVKVEGAKGKLEFTVPAGIIVKSENGEVSVLSSLESREMKALHGTARARIANMVLGVTEGYKKELKIIGVGYRAKVEGKTLNLLMGFSHPVPMPIPEDVKIETPGPTQIIVSGIDKHRVGQVTAIIRDVLKPEPYKGKGIRYVDEYVRRKAGKAVTGSK